jgi:hypothetical protein
VDAVIENEFRERQPKAPPDDPAGLIDDQTMSMAATSTMWGVLSLSATPWREKKAPCGGQHNNPNLWTIHATIYYVKRGYVVRVSQNPSLFGLKSLLRMS